MTVKDVYIQRATLKLLRLTESVRLETADELGVRVIYSLARVEDLNKACEIIAEAVWNSSPKVK